MAGLHVQETGIRDGPPVLLAGSLGTDRRMWSDLATHLAPTRRVLAVDLPGHGRSGGARASTDLGDLAAALEQVVVGRLRGRPAHLVGCSLGAMAALQLAHDHPSAVASLTLTCTSAHLGAPASWRRRADQVCTEGLATIADAVLERWLPAPVRARRPELVARCHTMLLATAPEAYATYCELLASLDLREIATRVGCPSLVLSGALDTATPPDHGRWLADNLVAARHVVIPGAGHLAPLDSPAAVASALLHFQGDDTPSPPAHR